MIKEKESTTTNQACTCIYNEVCGIKHSLDQLAQNVHRIQEYLPAQTPPTCQDLKQNSKIHERADSPPSRNMASAVIPRNYLKVTETQNSIVPGISCINYQHRHHLDDTQMKKALQWDFAIQKVDHLMQHPPQVEYYSQKQTFNHIKAVTSPGKLPKSPPSAISKPSNPANQCHKTQNNNINGAKKENNQKRQKIDGMQRQNNYGTQDGNAESYAKGLHRNDFHSPEIRKQFTSSNRKEFFQDVVYRSGDKECEARGGRQVGGRNHYQYQHIKNSKIHQKKQHRKRYRLLDISQVSSDSEFSPYEYPLP